MVKLGRKITATCTLSVLMVGGVFGGMSAASAEGELLKLSITSPYDETVTKGDVEWYGAPDATLTSEVVGESPIGALKLYKNGAEIVSEDELEENEWTHDEAISESEGVVEYLLEAYELSETKRVALDFTAPVLSESSIDQSEVSGGNTYVPLSGGLYATYTDTGIGLAKVEIFNAGVLVKDISNGAFTPADLGAGVGDSLDAFEIRATDELGNVAVQTVPNALGIAGSLVVAADMTSNGTVNINVTGQSIGGWYKEDAAANVVISSDKFLQRDRISVNGQNVTGSPVVENGQRTYQIPADVFRGGDGGEYHIEASTRGPFNTNSQTVTRTMRVDDLAPNLGAVRVEGGQSNIVGSVLYVDNKNAKLVVPVSDIHSGIDAASILVERISGGVVPGAALEGDNIVVPITSGDAYKFTVKDNVGHSTSATTQDLGLDVTRMVADDAAPKVERVGWGNPDFVEGSQNWYKGYPDLGWKVSDETLSDVQVYVNGTEAYNESLGGDIPGTDGVLEPRVKLADFGDSGVYEVRIVATDLAGNRTEEVTRFNVDVVKPEIVDFNFIDPGYKEGSTITTDDRYGFYFSGATRVEVTVKDEGHSSGIKGIAYELRAADGTVVKEATIPANNGVASIDIPVNFKGFVNATPTDNVGNVGASKHPSGVITSDRNWHVSTTDLRLNIPEPGKTDSKGQPLFKSAFDAGLDVTQTSSGIREITYGTAEAGQRGIAEADNAGNINGGFNVAKSDRNLVTQATGGFGVDSNINDLVVWASVKDRTGHESRVERIVSIDKDAPVIAVAYDSTIESGFYPDTRVATITIAERNFNPEDVVIGGTPGQLGSWTNVDGVWTNTMVFSAEDDYQWTLEYTDMAGNVGNSYQSEKFTIDKTAPVLNVEFNNNSAANEMYYKDARTATVTINEHNFDPSGVNYSGSGEIGGWAQNGDTWSAAVSFAEDGEYEFTVGATDKAGHTSENFSSGKFIIDQTAPKLEVTGASNGTSYAGDTEVGVSFSDTHLDPNATKVTLNSREGGEVELKGSVNASTGEFTSGSFPKEKSLDDYYSLSVVAVDLAGNQVEEDRVFSLNRFGSKYRFLNKDYEGKYMQELPADVAMEQSSVDKVDVPSIKPNILRGGAEVELGKGAVKVSESGGETSRWLYNVAINKGEYKKDGVYQTQLYSNLAGSGKKESSMQQEYAFVIDSEAPQVIVSGIEDGGSYNSVAQPVTVEVRDLSGAERVEFSANGKALKFTAESDVYTMSIPAEKDVEFVAVVTDKAGNVANEKLNVYVTASAWDAFIKSTFGKVALSALGIAGLLGLISLIVLAARRKKRKEQEEDVRAAVVAASQESLGSGSTGGSSDRTLDGGGFPAGSPLAAAMAAGAVGAAVAGASHSDPEQPVDAPEPEVVEPEPFVEPEFSEADEDDQATGLLDEDSESTDFLDSAEESTSTLGEDESGTNLL